MRLSSPAAALRGRRRPSRRARPPLSCSPPGPLGCPKASFLSHAGYAHQLASEWRLHLDLRQGDRVLWPADPGWVVGSFTLLGALAGGAEVTLLDGNPAATLARH